MSHAIKFPFAAPLQTELESVRDGKRAEDVQFIIVRIEKETVELVSVHRTLEEVKPQEHKPPLFILVRKTDQPSRWGLLSYVPDTCSPKEKMLSASCGPHVRKTCGLDVYRDVRINDEEDIAAALRSIHDAKEDIPAEKASPTAYRAEDMAPRPTGFSHGVSVKLAEEVAGSVKELLDRSREDVVLRLRGDVLYVDANANALDDAAPCYYATWGGETFLCYFVCPTSSKVKERMVYASSKSSVVEHLRGLGCSIEKCSESSDAADVRTAVQEARSGKPEAPAVAAAQPVAPPRPRGPGKGPAMLIGD